MALKYWRDDVYPFWFWVSGALREVQTKMQPDWFLYYVDNIPRHFLIGGFQPSPDDVAVEPFEWIDNTRHNWIEHMERWQRPVAVRWAAQAQQQWIVGQMAGMQPAHPPKPKESKSAGPNAALPVIMRLSGTTAEMVKEICGIKE